MRLMKRLGHRRRVVKRKVLSGSVVGGSGLFGLIYVAFIASGAFPPLAPIGLTIVILGALVGTLAVLSIVALPLGMLIY